MRIIITPQKRMQMSMRIIYQPHPRMRIWVRILKQCGLSADAYANTRYISSVYHASVVIGCVPVSISSSLIYHFWFLKHHHSAAMPHHHHRCKRQLSYQRKLHSCRANNNYFLYIFFNFLLSVFGIVFNCIIQNNSYC